MRDSDRVLGLVLAGGRGTRLMPLTAQRAKPAVPFGSIYRLIDFALSNLFNGGIRKIVVLTQYKSHSLDRHLAHAWRLPAMTGEYVLPVPAQMRNGPHWFSGSADAIYQNLNVLRDERPDYVCVFSADHVYRIDPEQMIAHHSATGAGVTVAGIRVPVEQASSFGIIEVGEHGRVAAFHEKPATVTPLPAAPGYAYASMGIYVFSTDTLIDAVCQDAANPWSRHDIGGNIMPLLVERGEVLVYDFNDNHVPGSKPCDQSYWRDVGDIDSYYRASMDLLGDQPAFDLYNVEWPIHGWLPSPVLPARLTTGASARHGSVINSLLGPGAVVEGGLVRNCVVAHNVRIGPGALVEDSVLMSGSEVGEGAVIRGAIIDKDLRIPPGARIHAGEHPVGAHLSPLGVVAIGKATPLLLPDRSVVSSQGVA